MAQAKVESFRKAKKSVLGLTVKYLILGLLNGLGVFSIYLLVLNQLWFPAVALGLALIGIDWLYLTEKLVPLKYLIPGTIAMAVFGVFPIAYTIQIAFTNYSTGHVMSKDEAIEAIERDGFIETVSYALQVAVDDATGDTVLLLKGYDSLTLSEVGDFVGTKDGLTPSPVPLVLDELTYLLITPDGYTALSDEEANTWISSSDAYSVPVDDGTFIITTPTSASLQSQRWVYDTKTDSFTDTTCGNVFTDNNKGQFQGTSCETAEDQVIEKGWIVGVGFDNFVKIFKNPRYSEPMFRVFTWTVIYAFSSVFLTFTVGMLVAFLFNVPKMRGRRIYRGLLIIPYAIPGFLSLLVWRGLLNDSFGAINQISGLTIPWLTDPNWAKISILLVNTWLGFPYMFLVATGALQSIPAELKEAASVDGATKFQVFRNVTLPLLLVAVGPLLVGSFSFNFNNFNQIYLLTEGGPEIADSNSAAGATDILISYTYKLAFVAGQGENYALSSAVSILLFFIVGSLSFWSFRRSKALENMS